MFSQLHVHEWVFFLLVPQAFPYTAMKILSCRLQGERLSPEDPLRVPSQAIWERICLALRSRNSRCILTAKTGCFLPGLLHLGASGVSTKFSLHWKASWQAVYGVLKEAEHRSTFYIPYWKIPLARALVPRQRTFGKDLTVINDCLDDLITRAKETRSEGDEEALQSRDYSKVFPFCRDFIWCAFNLIFNPQMMSFHST